MTAPLCFIEHQPHPPASAELSVPSSCASTGPKSCSRGWGQILEPRGTDPGLPLGAWGSQACCHPFFCSTTHAALSLGMFPLMEVVPPSPACERLKLE